MNVNKKKKECLKFFLHLCKLLAGTEEVPAVGFYN